MHAHISYPARAISAAVDSYNLIDHFTGHRR